MIFVNYNPKSYKKNVQKPFWLATKLFSAKIWKMTKCHFGANAMLRQPQVWESRASHAQKSRGLRVVYSKNFSRRTFFFLFSGELIWSICFWVICRWNKFEEKAQCVTVPNGPKPKIRFLNFLLDLSLSTYSRVLSSRVSRLANLHSQTKILLL